MIKTQAYSKVIVSSEDYLQALEAHKNQWPIKIKGKVIHNKNSFTITDLEEFIIMSP